MGSGNGSGGEHGGENIRDIIARERLEEARGRRGGGRRAGSGDPAGTAETSANAATSTAATSVTSNAAGIAGTALSAVGNAAGDALTRLSGRDGLLNELTPGAVVRALPGMAKIVAEGIWRTNQWTINATLRIGNIVIQGAISGQSANVLLEQLGTEAKDTLRRALGVVDLPDPLPKALRERVLPGAETTAPRDLTLPQRVEALLDASADLDFAEESHPAYVRLLSELAPDEARILRLFARRGPQAAVDVRTRRLFGAGSTLIAPGITMIGRYAGCRDIAKVPAYLNNLFRLGLIWFSREALPEQGMYDVLEVQEEVLAALHKAGRGITVRRSIELTAFGRNLCAMAGLLPPEEVTSAVGKKEETRKLPPPDAR